MSSKLALSINPEQTASPIQQSIGRKVGHAVIKSLSQITWGYIKLTQPDGETIELGQPRPDEPHVAVQINDYRFYTALALERDIGLGRAWALQYWQADDLYAAMRILIRSQQQLSRSDKLVGWLSKLVHTSYHRRNANSVSKAKENISAHYDLGNDFFESWLDPSMMYSSAFYKHAESTLSEAQFEKNDRICRKLDLQPGQSLLEIGTGWGGFAMHAAKHYGVNVITTTISKEQHDYAKQAIEAAGLASQITLLLEDYRELKGQYDAIVSIEMIEAVGYQYYDSYFDTLCRCLKPTGEAVIQAITVADQDFDAYKDRADFIKHFIFPGGCLPSIASLLDSNQRRADLLLSHVEDFGPHYCRTLLDWHERFQAALPSLNSNYRDPWFVGLWQFYLLVCAALFKERQVGLAQLHFTKPLAQPRISP